MNTHNKNSHESSLHYHNNTNNTPTLYYDHSNNYSNRKQYNINYLNKRPHPNPEFHSFPSNNYNYRQNNQRHNFKNRPHPNFEHNFYTRDPYNNVINPNQYYRNTINNATNPNLPFNQHISFNSNHRTPHHQNYNFPKNRKLPYYPTRLPLNSHTTKFTHNYPDKLKPEILSIPKKTALWQSNTNISLLNTQSLNNKPELIHSTIINNNIDFMCLTETWATHDSIPTFIAATPNTHYSLNHPWHSRGGGSAAISRNSIKLLSQSSSNINTFELTQLQLQLPNLIKPLKLIILYIPSNSKNVTDTLTEILHRFYDLNNILINGDFNSDLHSISFLNILNDLNLTQHISEPTQSKGNMLDLIISNKLINLINLTEIGPQLTDHNLISIYLNLVKVPNKRIAITYRPTKIINPITYL